MRASRGHGLLKPLLLVLAAFQLATAVRMAFAPRAFYDAIAGFGPYNPHLLGDLATVYAAIGLALLVAVVRPGWRVPVLALTLVQYVLHLVNHALDIEEGRRDWMGPVNVALLVLGCLVLAAALRLARADDAERAREEPA